MHDVRTSSRFAFTQSLSHATRSAMLLSVYFSKFHRGLCTTRAKAERVCEWASCREESLIRWQQASERISSVVVYLPEMIFAFVNSAGEYPRRRRARSTTCTSEWQLSNCRQLTNKQIAEVQSAEMLSSRHKAKSHESWAWNLPRADESEEKLWAPHLEDRKPG